MSIKCLSISLLILVMTAGCHMLDQQSPPDVRTAPPYWQSQHQLAKSQLAEMHAFHDKESAQISEDINRFHNHEIERLQAAGKELEKDKPQQKNEVKTQEPGEKGQSEKWNWFKKKNKETKIETSAVSSRPDDTNRNVR